MTATPFNTNVPFAGVKDYSGDVDYSGTVPYQGQVNYSGAAGVLGSVDQTLVKGADGKYTQINSLTINGSLVKTWSVALGLVDPPAPPVSPLIIGVVTPRTRTYTNGAPFDYVDHINAMGKARTKILGQYNPPGARVTAFNSPSANWPTQAQYDPSGATKYSVQIRIKDFPHESWVLPYFNSIPDHIETVYISGQHEIKPGESFAPGNGPGNNNTTDVAITPAVFKSIYTEYARIRALSPNKARIKLVPVFMQYQVDVGMDLTPWMPTEADFFGNDCYSNELFKNAAGQYSYRPIADLLADTFAYARQFGKPAMLSEWGAQIDSGAPLQNDTLRAAWITEGMALMRSQPPLPDGRPLVHAVTWWSSQSTNTTNGVRNDFVLLRPEAAGSLAAYK